MKNIYFSFLFLLFSIVAIGQNAPSPYAMNYAKFTEIPVNAFTGTASFTVPIGTVTDGPLSLPVYLSYHTAGNRVGVPASDVGLGWHLMAGGAISRTIRGVADDNYGLKGYYHFGDQLSWSSSTHREEVADGDRDGEPDIYYYSFGGYSGKFSFDQYDVIHYMPLSDVKIVPVIVNNKMEGFKGYTPEGNIYYFGKYGSIDALEETLIDGTYEGTTWFLLRIESADGKHYIELDYEIQSMTFYTLTESLRTGYFQSGNIQWVNNPISSYNNVKYGKSGLLSIKNSTSNQEVVFTRQLRGDFYTPYSYSPKLIDKIEVNNGSYCIEYDLIHDYFIDNSVSGFSSKRLRLDEVRKKACSTSLSEPAFKFDYYGGNFFPNLLSKRIDKWDFYNGVSSNDNLSYLHPLSSVTLSGGTVSDGSANRNSDKVGMEKGMLQKITLPTGGTTEIEYEANEYLDETAYQTQLFSLQSCTGSSTCCGPQNDETTETINQDMINTGTLKMTLTDYDGSYPSCYYFNPTAELTLYIYDETNGGGQIYTTNFNTSTVAYLNIDLDNISGMTAGNSYRFKITSEYGKGEMTLDYTSSYTNQLCGGLRISKTTVYDGISTANNIVREYEYVDENDSNKSSGTLYRNPEFGYKPNGSSYNAIFSSNSVRPLSGMGGYHVSYDRVVIKHNGNGKQVLEFNSESPLPQGPTYYPPAADKLLVIAGTPKTENIYNEGGTLEASSNTTGITEGNSYFASNAFAARRGYYWSGSSGNPTHVYSNTNVSHVTNLWRPSTVTSTIDGISTTITLNYHSTDAHLLPISTSVDNSDGKTTTTETTYTVEYSDNTIKDDFIGRNMKTLPYETKIKIDGTQVDGTKVNYSYFDCSGYPNYSPCNNYGYDPPLSYESLRYEITGTGSASGWTGGSYVVQSTITERYPANLLVKKSKKPNWLPTTITYNSDKLPISKSFNGHTTSYSYYTNSSLLQQVTAVDGTTTSYTYDDLMRLKTATDNCNSIVTTYTYHFTTGGSDKNYINEKVDYPSASYSAVDILETKTFKDGLGRDIQTILKNQGTASTYDVVIATEYDNQGRVKRSYEAKEYNYNYGNYKTPNSSWPHTLHEYYSSPLNRKHKVTPPGWYATIYNYGANSSGDAVKIDGGSSSYGANLLVKQTVEDGNGNKSIVFTDKKGRTILSRQTDNADQSSKRLDTYYLYDDKGRQTYVLPPDATTSTSDLYYKYVYDEDDKLLEKYIPGAAVVKYKYYNTDILSAYQDGYLSAQGKWYAYTYDSFGRELKSGFYNGTPSDNASSNLSLSESLTENIYGTTSAEKDKIKTVKTKVLGGSTWLQTTNTYNSCGRITSQSSNNHVNTGTGSESTTFLYDGAGNVTRTTYNHSAHGTTKTIRSTQTYLHAGQPKLSYFRVDSGTDQIISSKKFDHKGQMINNYQGYTYLGGQNAYLQKIDYTYYDNGLLHKINENDLTGTQTSLASGNHPNPGTPSTSDYDYKDLYYQELFYDSPVSGTSATAQKNGNIANMTWQVRGRERQIYAYSYDEYDRLKSATHYDQNSSGTITNNNRFNVFNINYDDRGNLTQIARKGLTPSGSNWVVSDIDNMLYGMYPNENTVQTILEFGNNNHGFENLNNGNTTYLYDVNGNLKKDNAKEIDIVYNHLDLPVSISFYDLGQQKIEFTYDAGGNLLTKKMKNSSGTVIETRDYINGTEYVDGILESIYHSEGRVNYDCGSSRYEYNFRDHLGNTRVIYTDLNGDGIVDINSTSEELVKEIQYYPWGMVQDGPWMSAPSGCDYAYQYNGIELVDDFGLGVNMATYRTLDPAIGRWWSVDPEAEAMIGLSPYNSMNNNPVSFSDPDGDLAFMPILIGAGIGVLSQGISNTINNQGFFNDWWKGALTGAIGGTLGQFGGGSLLNDIVWGAAEGGITGGIGSKLNGGSFWSGFGKGAALGAGLTFAYNLPNAIKNAKDGFGFRTNIDAFKNAADEAVIDGVVDNAKAQRALDFWTDRFGGPKLYRMKMLNRMSPFTDPTSGKIYITDLPFLQGGDHVASTIIHETAHYYKSIRWKNGVGSTGSTDMYVEGLDIIPDNGHGTIGYYDAIRQSGKYNISYKTLNGTPKNGLVGNFDKKAWNSFGWKKWWYNIPRRFK